MERRRGVLAVVGGCLAVSWPGALVFGYPGVMAGYWQASLGVGRGALGAMLFVMLAAVGTFMFLVGRWQARLGVRRMAFVGQLVCVGSLVWAAWAPGLAAVYVWAFAAGASSCFVYLPALTAAQLWWPAHRGLASGIVNMAFAASAAVLSPLFVWLLKTAGYAATNLVVAVLAVAIGGLGAWFLVLPHGTSSPLPTASAPALSTRRILASGAFRFLWITWALQGAAGVSLITLSGVLGRDKGFSLEQTVTLLVVFNLASGLSRLLMGALSDRIGRTASMSGVFAAAGFAYLAFPHAAGVTASSLLAAVVGFAFGTLFTVSAPLTMECFGPENFAPVYGLVFTAYGFVAGLLGPWLSGYLVDASNGSPSGACLYLGAFSLAASLLIRHATPDRCPL